MSANVTVATDAQGVVWINADTMIEFLRTARDLIAQADLRTQIAQFGSVDGWLTIFTDQFEESLDGIGDEASE